MLCENCEWLCVADESFHSPAAVFGCLHQWPYSFKKRMFNPQHVRTPGGGNGGRDESGRTVMCYHRCDSLLSVGITVWQSNQIHRGLWEMLKFLDLVGNPWMLGPVFLFLGVWMIPGLASKMKLPKVADAGRSGDPSNSQQLEGISRDDHTCTYLKDEDSCAKPDMFNCWGCHLCAESQPGEIISCCHGEA